jgi:gliding motility-associated-like protein
MRKTRLLICGIAGMLSMLFGSISNSYAQTFFCFRWAGVDNIYYKAHIPGTDNGCTGSGSCDFEYTGPGGVHWWGGITMSPEGDLYGLYSLMNNNDAGIYLYDTIDGSSVMVFDLVDWPIGPAFTGFIGIGGGVFYTTGKHILFGPDSLFQININTGQITNLGYIPFEVTDDIALIDGEFYMHDETPPETGIIKLDVTNPGLSTNIFPSPPVLLQGMTASGMCNTLMTTRQITNPNWEILLFHLGDGTVTSVCSTPRDLVEITSMREHMPSNCEITIDLDCNDSSGATDFDFNSNEFTCLTDGVPVTDYDIGMVYDLIIESMTIEITGSNPDAPLEILTSTGSVPNISVTGDGTDMITLTNEGGAKSTDFKDALRLIRYQNNAESPTGGLRTVEVQFTTESGSQSNVATAFINVVELPLVPVDLGDDMQICEGETETFDAGIPGADYEWSNGDDTQTITVDQSGEYIVTVADGENCPGIDTVVLEVLPVIDVSLSGDSEICDNEHATIIINTSTPFALNIDISSDPGSPFNFPNVTGNTTFTDLISDQTTYTITSVTPSQDVCIILSDSEQIIDVYPSFNHAFEVSICDGDSVWLGFYWETEAGIYENTFESFDGCDSVVTTTIHIVPAIQLSAQGTTCDSSEVGVFLTTIDNPNGCDTTITTTITLAPGDTTLLNNMSCILAQSGINTDTLSNLAGCDSLIISAISYQPPSDTTFNNASTCDSSQIGVSQFIVPAVDGCDSLIITNTSFAASDTSYATGTSCDSASIGVFQTLLQNQQGCDSLVILSITAGIPDTTDTSSTSCDSSSLGVFVHHYTNIVGCDSVVFLTVTYSAVDSTFADDTTCDPGNAGVFIEMYVNQYGCDSIVTTTVSLLSSDTISISGNTCDPDDAGVIIEALQNVYGCDSIVTTTITLLPTSTTDLIETTCISAEAGVFVSTLINQYGCDSIVTLTVTLVDADTTRLDFMTCFEDEVGSNETLFTGADGCDSLVVSTTALYPETVVALETLYDYNGFDISCEGGEDGGIVASVNGLSPFTYQWSTGSTDEMITGLPSGNYELTITNYVGCEAVAAITLTEPSALALAFSISEPGCFDNALGSIEVIPSGGVPPFAYSLDGVNFQSDPQFSNLGDGIYQITALDANDCETKEIISIHVPLSVMVQLSDDQVISHGDSATMEAVINLPFDSIANIQWSGIDSIDCPNCLTQIVAPIITTAYSVSVTSADGCSDSDTTTVFVSTDHHFYIPNIFSPNGDGINDKITIHTSADVEAILSFVIFDRWGNLVFEKNSNEPVVEWDGKFKGKSLNPGVFTFLAEVKYNDGLIEKRYGDITLLR